MNKRQTRVAWIMALALSAVSMLIGILTAQDAFYYDRGRRSQSIYYDELILPTCLAFAVPILLLGGLAFYRAKEKGEKLVTGVSRTDRKTGIKEEGEKTKQRVIGLLIGSISLFVFQIGAGVVGLTMAGSDVTPEQIVFVLTFAFTFAGTQVLIMAVGFTLFFLLSKPFSKMESRKTEKYVETNEPKGIKKLDV